jgi:hypothetical protein
MKPALQNLDNGDAFPNIFALRPWHVEQAIDHTMFLIDPA